MNILILSAPVYNVAEGTGSITKHIQGNFANQDQIDAGSIPPMAIYHLKEILKMHGHNVKLIDPFHFKNSNFFSDKNNGELIIKELLNKIDVVGISANSGNWATSRYIISLIKSLSPSTPVVLGGVHASYLDQYIMESTDVDFIIRGEGEVSLPRLLDIIGEPEQYNTIDNLTYRGINGEIKRTNNTGLLSINELEKYPLSDYEEVPEGKYMGLPLETSRGCKYKCLFCSVVYRGKWRGYSPENVIDRIEKIYPIVKNKTTSKKWVCFVDDCFTADPVRALNILNMVNQRNLDLVFLLECRVNDLLSTGFIESVPKNLVGHMQIGVDAGYDEGLKKIRKGITIADVEKCASLLHQHGLNEYVDMSFIIGFPWENSEQIVSTVNTAAYLSKKYDLVSCINWFYYFPSDLWALRKEYKIDINEEIFDNPKLIVDVDTFFKTHPQISLENFKIISNLIQNYQEKGIKISYKNAFS